MGARRLHARLAQRREADRRGERPAAPGLRARPRARAAALPVAAGQRRPAGNRAHHRRRGRSRRLFRGGAGGLQARRGAGPPARPDRGGGRQLRRRRLRAEPRALRRQPFLPPGVRRRPGEGGLLRVHRRGERRGARQRAGPRAGGPHAGGPRALRAAGTRPGRVVPAGAGRRDPGGKHRRGLGHRPHRRFPAAARMRRGERLPGARGPAQPRRLRPPVHRPDPDDPGGGLQLLGSGGRRPVLRPLVRQLAVRAGVLRAAARAAFPRGDGGKRQDLRGPDGYRALPRTFARQPAARPPRARRPRAPAAPGKRRTVRGRRRPGDCTR